MAVAFDAATESVRTGTTDPHTFTHTPVGTPRGVVLAIVHGTESTDLVTGTVSYGGVAMTRVVTAADATTEPGRAYLYFLGTGIPTGAQTVSADLSSATTTDIEFTCITVTAAKDTSVVDSDSLSDNVANPSVTLQYNGLTSIAFAALYGGGAAPSSFAQNANCTAVASEDLGAFYGSVIRQTTPGTADFAIGGTAAIDDVAYVALAVTERTDVTVTAVPAAASGGSLTGDAIDVGVGPLTAAATASIAAPTVGQVALVVAPAAAATAAVSAPLPLLRAAPSAAASAASVAAPTPTVTVTAVAAATAAVSAPIVTAAGAIVVPAATATASVPTPDGMDVTVGPLAAAATAAVTAPGVTATAGGTTVAAAVATATAGIPTPDGIDVTIGPEAANADAGINTAPSVVISSGAQVIVAAPAAQATAVSPQDDVFPWLEAANPPVIAITVTAQATATASAPSPLPLLRAAPAAAAATAAATGPVVGPTVAATAATATASAAAPIVPGGAGNILVAPTAASATASAPAPLPLLTVAPATAAATATTTSHTPEVKLGLAVAAVATAAAASPTANVTVVATAAQAFTGASAVINVPSSVIITASAASATARVVTPDVGSPLFFPRPTGDFALIHPTASHAVVVASETTVCAETLVCDDGLAIAAVAPDTLVLTPA